MKLRVKKLEHCFQIPTYATEGSAGLDLYACHDTRIEPRVLAMECHAKISTGVCLEIPEGFEGQVRPRSGLAARKAVTVLNAPGTIDSDYRGEVKVLLINLGSTPVDIKRGDRVAQLVIAPVTKVKLVEVSSLDDSERGDGGFGSTGV